MEELFETNIAERDAGIDKGENRQYEESDDGMQIVLNIF